MEKRPNIFKLVIIFHHTCAICNPIILLKINMMIIMNMDFESTHLSSTFGVTIIKIRVHPMGHLKRLKVMKSKSVSCSVVFWTPWTVACQAPLSMEFSRQEYWSG